MVPLAASVLADLIPAVPAGCFVELRLRPLGIDDRSVIQSVFHSIEVRRMCWRQPFTGDLLG